MINLASTILPVKKRLIDANNGVEITSIHMSSGDFLSSTPTVPAGALKNCVGLTDLVIESGCDVTLAANVFNGCSGLRNVDLTGVIGMQTTTFTGCTGITDIVAP